VICDRRRLSHALDGELSAQEEAELSAHVAECATCRDTLAAYRRLGERIRGEAGPTLPADFARRVYERVTLPDPIL
jgi:anti-sigma factor RsiW